MRTEKINLYENREDVFLTTYLWDASPEMPAGEQRPLLLICPGGGYLNCSDREAEPVALRFAGMGYHTAVLRYSTYGERREDFAGLDSPDPVKSANLYPAQLLELGRAMLLLKRHAAQWHIDAQRIALCGFSAGGHNCALYATRWYRPELAEALNATSEELRPAALLLGYPVINFAIQEGISPEDRELYRCMELAFLGTDHPDECLLRETDPSACVAGREPPMFIWATAADRTVPVRNSLILATSLALHGVPFELHLFESGPHGMGLADQASAAVTHNMDDSAANWTKLAELWLRKRFALHIEEGQP